MYVLKTLLIVIVAFIAVLLILALFVNKNYTVVKEVTINKPKADVFNYIKYVKNQDNFSKWNQLDPAMKRSYTGMDGTVGFIYAWDGNKKAGHGEQEIKNIVDGERIDYEIRFKRPFESTATSFLASESAGDKQTKVKWTLAGHSSYPLNLMNLLVPSILGDDLQTSLGNLKNILEK